MIMADRALGHRPLGTQTVSGGQILCGRDRWRKKSIVKMDG